MTLVPRRSFGIINDPVVSWLHAFDADIVKRGILKVEDELVLCKRPKCQSFRHFVLALGRFRIGSFAEGKIALRDAVTQHLLATAEDTQPRDQHREVRRTVLAKLIGHAANEVSTAEELELAFARSLAGPGFTSQHECAMFWHLKGVILLKYSDHVGSLRNFDQSLFYTPDIIFALRGKLSSLELERKAKRPGAGPDRKELDACNNAYKANPNDRKIGRSLVKAIYDKLTTRRGYSKTGTMSRQVKDAWGKIATIMGQLTEGDCKVSYLVLGGMVCVALPSSFGDSHRLLFDRLLTSVNRSFCSSSPLRLGCDDNRILGKILVDISWIHLSVHHMRLAAMRGRDVAVHLDYINIMYHHWPAETKNNDILRAFRIMESNAVYTKKDRVFYLFAYAQFYQQPRPHGDFARALKLIREAKELASKSGIPEHTEYPIFPCPVWERRIRRSWRETNREPSLPSPSDDAVQVFETEYGRTLDGNFELMPGLMSGMKTIGFLEAELVQFLAIDATV